MKGKNIVSIFTISLMFGLFFIFSGCKNASSKKVGFLLHQLDDRWSMDITYLKDYFEKDGVTFILKDAAGDENLQLKQTQELIDEGVDVILIVAVNQNTAAGIVRMSHNNNIPVIGYDRMIQNANLDYLLSFEYSDIGAMQVEYAHKKVPKGNYVLFWGDSFDENARFMQKAQMEYLQPYIDRGDINIIYRGYIDDWSANNASQMMNKILQFSDKQIDVVISGNDAIAGGVIKAVNENNVQNEILVTGQDATLDACKLIAKGNQRMTIYKPISNLAKVAVKMSEDIMVNKKIETNSLLFNGRNNIPAILLDGIVVDAKNIESTIIADNFHSYNDIYNLN